MTRQLIPGELRKVRSGVFYLVVSQAPPGEFNVFGVKTGYHYTWTKWQVDDDDLVTEPEEWK